MTVIRRIRVAKLPAEIAKTGFWPAVSTTDWEPADAERFTQLRNLIERYLAGEKIKQLLKACNLDYIDLYRALDRCTTRHSDGLVFGWRGLIKGLRVKEYTRKAEVRAREPGSLGGYSGALTAFFSKHRSVKKDFDTYLRTARPASGGTQSIVTPQAAHREFIRLSDQLGLSELHWPYSTIKKGKDAVRTYVKRFFDEHYEDIAQTQYGETAVTKSKTGTGETSLLEANFPFDCVEVDEHRAHFLGTLGIPTPSGTRYVPISRVILITVTDRRTGVILGYHAVFRREANSSDFLTAVNNALEAWTPRAFSLPGLRYDDGAGFPSSRSPLLTRVGWGSMLVDNALIHIAEEVMDRVMDMVGCDISFGAVKRPERRAMAELAFKRLSDQGFTRVESTTGSHAADPKRQSPEQKACKTCLDMGAVLDLVELAIAHYNAAETKRAHAASGLDLMEQLATDEKTGFLVPRLPPALDHVAPLNISIFPANVTGDRAAGVRPRVFALYGYYTSSSLSDQWVLIGSSIQIFVDPDDVSTVRAFTHQGAFIGELKRCDSWGRGPMSLEMCRQIQRLLDEKKLTRNVGESYADAFLRSLEERAAQDALKKPHAVSQAATRLADEQRKRARKNTAETAETSTEAIPSEESTSGAPPGRFQSDVYAGPTLVYARGIKAVN